MRRTVTNSDLATGGGSGGVLLLAIDVYVQEPHLKELALYAVPAVSVVAAGVSAYVMGYVREVASGWFKSFRQQRAISKARRGLRSAKAHLVEIEADVSASNDHKKKARLQVEAFEQALLAFQTRVDFEDVA